MIWKVLHGRRRSFGDKRAVRILKGERLEDRMCLASGPLPAIPTDSDALPWPLAATVQQPESEQSIQLSELTNRVSFAGEGFGTLRVSPNGGLGQLYYIDEQLHYRSRSATGNFVDQIVADVDSYAFPTYTRGTPAQLVYQSDGSPIVLIAQGDGFGVYESDGDGSWSSTDFVTFPQNGNFDVTGQLLAEIGPDDSIHAIFTAGAWFYGRMFYATNQSGQWQVSEIAQPAAAGSYNHFFSLDSRYVSMVVSDDGFVHIAYTPEFLDFGEGGFRRPFDQLAYLSNRSGPWITEIVHQPSDDSGQSGLASSIAIAPDGQPAIASFFVDRYQTGSAVSSKLLLHQRDANGNWASEVVTDHPDGYVAGDGPKFTGFAPHLVFDAVGRAHIAFSDHASQHFASFGAEEFAGQIRHAVKDANNWSFSTVFPQSDPLRNVMSYPTMAILPHQVVFVGIQRIDELDENLLVISESYNYVESVLPQTGITLLVENRNLPFNGSVDIVIQRHHGDWDIDTTVSLQSNNEPQIASRQFVIPAGKSRLETTLEILSPTSLEKAEIVSLTATADGYYPGSTTVIVAPIDLKWHNDLLAHDVNNDDQITPRDALAVINWIGITSASGHPPSGTPVYYPDVNGDGNVSPRDALQVINFLATAANSQNLEAEAIDAQLPDAIAFLTQANDDDSDAWDWQHVDETFQCFRINPT